MRAPAQSPAGVERLGHTRVALDLESLTHPSPAAGPAGKYDKVEIERVASWLKAHRDEPSRFELIEGKLLINAPKAVCSKLMRHAAHPDLRAELAELVKDRQRVQEATVPLQGAAKPRVISTWSPPVKAQRPAHHGLPNRDGARALRGLSYGPRSPVNLPQPQVHRESIVRTEGLSSSESEQRAESIRAESPQKRLDMRASGLAHVKPPREQSGSDPLSLLIPATAPSPPPQHAGRDAPQAGATAAPSPRQSRHGAPDAGGRCHGQGAQNGVTSAAASRLHPALKAHEAFVAQHGELADEASPLGTTMRFWRHVVSHDEVIVFRAPQDAKSPQNMYCCAEPTVTTILKKYTAAASENSRVRNYLDAVLSSMPIASHEELQDLTPITLVALEDGFAPDVINALQSRRSAQCGS
jgi:hypothetical protein